MAGNGSEGFSAPAGGGPNQPDDLIAARREQVARLRLRKLTQREIRDSLAKLGHVNPDTGGPWALGTVAGDCLALEAEWRASAAEATAERKAKLLAEVEEVRRKAWMDNDLASVLKSIQQERDLLGLDSPQRSEVSGPDGTPIVVNFASVLSAARAAKAGRARG